MLILINMNQKGFTPHLLRATRQKVQNDRTKGAGFTIIEVLGAIFIIAFAVGGAFLLIQRNVSAVSALEHRSIAINLAQEGIEAVHAIRNSNYIDAASGGASTFTSNGLSQAACGAPTGCEIQCVNGGEFFPNCSAVGTNLVEIELVPFTDTFLTYDVATAVYSQGEPGTASLFKRRITIAENGDEVIVSAEVTWSEKGEPQNIMVETTLFNWLGI